MRFAAANSTNTGDYINAGKAVAGSAASMFDKQRKTGPDYTGLSKVAMAAQTAERIAANEAAAKMTTAAIKARGNVQTAKVTADANIELGQQQTNMRKAGILPAIGKIVGSTFKKDPVPPPPRLQVAPVMPDYPDYPTNVDRPAPPGEPVLEPLPNGLSTGDSSNTGSASVSSNTQPISPVSSEGSVDRKMVFDYLTQEKGLPRNNALGLMANIDRESGFRPAIASGDNGGPGGLFQWNGGRQTDTVSRLVSSGDWKGQIDYALSEPGEPYSQRYTQTTFNSPQAAADAWMTHWERPADTVSGSRKHTQYLGGYNF